MRVYSRYFTLALTVCCGLFSASSAIAVETLNSKELQRVEHITAAESKDDTICNTYIQGIEELGRENKSTAHRLQIKFT